MQSKSKSSTQHDSELLEKKENSNSITRIMEKCSKEGIKIREFHFEYAAYSLGSRREINQ